MGANVSQLFDLSDRVALVTGGGSGLGREFCDILAESGANVVCVDFYADRAEETCEIISRYGCRALPVKADVSDYGQVQSAFQLVESAFGRLDVLVNNAGILTRPTVIHEMAVEDWHRLISVSLNGVFYCMKEGLRLMIKQKKGSVINIASVAGQMGLDPDVQAIANYVAAKAGVIGLTMQGAAEYGRHNIRVNCISPGWHFGTRLAEGARLRATEGEDGTFQNLIAAMTPMKRTGKPEEIRGLLLYLASDASSFVTGQVIAQDGGWTCCR